MKDQGRGERWISTGVTELTSSVNRGSGGGRLGGITGWGAC